MHNIRNLGNKKSEIQSVSDAYPLVSSTSLRCHSSLQYFFLCSSAHGYKSLLDAVLARQKIPASAFIAAS
jgi:hypothetical protein